MKDNAQHLLVFGATGAIGRAIAEAALARGWQVTGVARGIAGGWLPGANALALDPLGAGFAPQNLRAELPYTAVCWAQGANCNDSVYDVDLPQHMDLYAANVAYILVTLQALLQVSCWRRHPGCASSAPSGRIWRGKTSSPTASPRRRCRDWCCRPRPTWRATAT